MFYFKILLGNARPHILILMNINDLGSMAVSSRVLPSVLYNQNIIWTDFRVYIYLFGVLRRFQHCTGHITTGSWKGRGNQYIQFVRVLYCKLPTNGKQLPAFPLEAVPGIEPRPQRWEARVLPVCHRGPLFRVYKPAISNLHIVRELSVS